jgi:hypothetical protein
MEILSTVSASLVDPKADISQGLGVEDIFRFREGIGKIRDHDIDSR